MREYTDELPSTVMETDVAAPTREICGVVAAAPCNVTTAASLMLTPTLLVPPPTKRKPPLVAVANPPVPDKTMLTMDTPLDA